MRVSPGEVREKSILIVRANCKGQELTGRKSAVTTAIQSHHMLSVTHHILCQQRPCSSTSLRTTCLHSLLCLQTVWYRLLRDIIMNFIRSQMAIFLGLPPETYENSLLSHHRKGWRDALLLPVQNWHFFMTDLDLRKGCRA